MARSVLAAQPVVTAGLAPVYGAADIAGSSFGNNGRRALHVKNASASPINVTITNQLTVDGLAVPNRVVAVPAGADRFIGPFGANYNAADSSGVWVDYSAVATVTVALLEV